MRIRTIAIHEYLTNVRRKEFILITLGLPLLMLLVIGIGALGAGAAIRQIMRQGGERVAFVDNSHSLSFMPETERASGFQIVRLLDEGEGRREVQNGKLAALVIVEQDYLESGRVRVYRKSGSMFAK